MVGCFSVCFGSPDPDPPVTEGKAKAEPVTPTKSSKKVSVVPTAGEYALEAGVDAIKIIKTSLGIVGGIPGAQEVLELALVLIETCEEIAEIEEKVSVLKDRIGSIMLVMVQGIQGKDSGGIPPGIIKDIEKLGTDLEGIKQDLSKIAAQSRLLTILFKAANKSKIEECMDRLKESLVHWEISRDISNGVALHNMQQGIDRVYEKVEDVQKSMGAMIKQAHTASHSSSRQMPPRPTIFYGRDKFVEDVVKILVATTGSGSPRICIHGPGGMGKTSAAIAVMEHPDIASKFSEKDRFWVPCVSATSADILLQILYSNLRISRDTGDYLADIVAELRSSSAPRLVLLDNFETPWDPSEGRREDVENILHSLSALPQLAILVTMRTNIPPSEQIDWVDKPLDAVDAETSNDIYCAIHPRAKGKPKLRELLVELGHMPFAVTLIATLGKTSKSMPDALLKDWRRLGPGMLSSDALEDSISRSIGLSMKSKQVAKNVYAQTLLATLAMLPAGTTHSHLDWWATALESKKKAAISVLNNVALVVDIEQEDSDEVLISVLPVVQSYMNQGGRIPDAVRLSVREACYKFVLEHKSSPGDPTFKRDLVVLSEEEMNIQTILLEATRLTDTIAPHLTSGTVFDIEKSLEVLVAFCWYQHWTRPRTEALEHTISVARKAQNDHFIAESLFCLGSTLFRLDRYKDACASYIEARDYFKKTSNIVRASECSFELADLYLYMQQPADARAAIDGVSNADMEGDAYVKARREMILGKYHWFLRRFPEALPHFDVAKRAFTATELDRPVDAAYCLHMIARTLASQDKSPAALQAADQSLEIYERCGPDNRLLEILLVKDYIMLKSSAPAAEGSPTLQQTLKRTLQKGQELGRPLAIAQALELFGEMFVQLGEAASAQEAYEAAQKEYETMGTAHMALNGISRCQYNCRVLTHMQENPDMKWNGRLLSDLLHG